MRRCAPAACLRCPKRPRIMRSACCACAKASRSCSSTAAVGESRLGVTRVRGGSAGEKMDSTVRKAVELGVAEVQPVLAARSLARPKGERAENRRAHWQKVVIAACEQCGRNRIPQVHPVIGLSDYRPSGEAMKILLSRRAELRL